ncbi:hypothetical protein PVAP13_6NG185203 [Panicum virgatum]|uniref:Uncharacterized protein n=1 Tax=Panicum virgatum TaxID=38727 RepID=A0A8T0QZ65_PANVG|nr:hypothetical protein PVAP13_6NG185203 [Panicum virgatum]
MTKQSRCPGLILAAPLLRSRPAPPLPGTRAPPSACASPMTTRRRGRRPISPRQEGRGASVSEEPARFTSSPPWKEANLPRDVRGRGRPSPSHHLPPTRRGLIAPHSPT